MNFGILHVDAITISDLWFQLIFKVLDTMGHSYIQDIQRGSFEKEQVRFQFPGIAGFISQPWTGMVPVMPVGMEQLAPTSREVIDDYFAAYLMDPALGENEVYKYASRIHQKAWLTQTQSGNLRAGLYSQLEFIIDMLKKTPLTNQAVIAIADPGDIKFCWGNDGKYDPPCLRTIDFKVIPDEDGLILTVSAYFRSWDIWAGLPTNLGGLELLKQFVADQAGLKSGPMYIYSAGAHVYGHHEDIVNLRLKRSSVNAK